jgi:hypothetical protein
MQLGTSVCIGKKVKVLGSPDLSDITDINVHDELKSIFDSCIGQEFEVVGIMYVEGKGALIELEVNVWKNDSEYIYIEPEYIEVIT